MERLPDSLVIGFWIAGALWVLALLAYLLGASMEWMFPLFMLGLLTGIAEWLMRRGAK